MAGTLTISTLSDGTNSTSSTNCIQGSAKAWVNFNATTNTIRSSYNVSSVTNNGAGFMQVNFTNAFPNVNYVPIAWAGNDGATRCFAQFDGNNSGGAGQITTSFLSYYNGGTTGTTFTTPFQWLVCFSA
jgi:hypothetical protein